MANVRGVGGNGPEVAESAIDTLGLATVACGRGALDLEELVLSEQQQQLGR